MASVTKYKCEECGREVEHRYCARGWIVLKTSDFTVYSGDKSKYYKRLFRGVNKYLDFCGTRCFIEYFEKASLPAGGDLPMGAKAHIPKPKKYVIENVTNVPRSFRVFSDLAKEDMEKVAGVSKVYSYSGSEGPYLSVYAGRRYNVDEVKACVLELINARS